MFKTIMVPVDLAHPDTLGRALRCAADLARSSGATVCLVGVTASTPGPLGANPEEYEKHLADFAAAQGRELGIDMTHRAVVCNDPTTDVDDALIRAVDDTGADLVVMATHKPGLGDYIWPSNGGRLAAHTAASVFLVRG